MSEVGGQEAERLVAGPEDGAEVSLVEGEDVAGGVALGEHHERGVGQAEVKVRTTSSNWGTGSNGTKNNDLTNLNNRL